MSEVTVKAKPARPLAQTTKQVSAIVNPPLATLRLVLGEEEKIIVAAAVLAFEQLPTDSQFALIQHAKKLHAEAVKAELAKSAPACSAEPVAACSAGEPVAA